MRILIQISRVLTGLLFIFSGMVKLNDPSGFSIKLNEYFDVFANDVAQKQDTLKLSIVDGVNVINTQNFPLFSGDRSRELQIESTTEVQVEQPAPDTSAADSSKPVTGKKKLRKAPAPKKIYLVKAVVKLRDQPAGEAVFRTQDSGAASMLVVKAEVAGKPVFQKDVRLKAGENAKVSSPINLESYVKKESKLHEFFHTMKNYSLEMSVLFCALEVILGFALLVGWSMGLTSTLMLLLILFFTFLTGYSWIYNKVTDCGCFGDFIKLKPKESFIKDVILSVLILIIFFGRKHIKPLFSKGFGWKFIGVISLLSIVFGVLCYLFLPVWDFLPYKEGNDIKKVMTEVPAGMRATDSIQMLFVLEKGKDSVSVTTKEYTDRYEKFEKEGWKFRRRVDKVIIEGWKSPIHDFAITNPANNTDLKDSFLNGGGYKLMWICTFLDKGYHGANPEITEIAKWAGKSGVKFYPLTATSAGPAGDYVRRHKLPFSFYSGDFKMLMTMARFSPTLYLFKGSTVVRKWSGLNLPSTKKLGKLTRS